MKRTAAWASCAFVALACTTATKPREPARPIAVAALHDAGDAPAPAPSTPDTTGWVKDWPKSWSDPRVVDALAASCELAPKTPPLGNELSTPPDPFACALGYAQSCSPDACPIDRGGCEKECSGACQGCGSQCTTSCTSCKAACTDDACRHGCAEKCAACKDACTAALDTCATAVCGKAHFDCERRVLASYKKNGCSARCKVYTRCDASCEEAKDPDACRRRCESAVSPGFGKCYAKCTALAAGSDAKEAACLLECYVDEPCAPYVCLAVRGYERTP